MWHSPFGFLPSGAYAGPADKVSEMSVTSQYTPCSHPGQEKGGDQFNGLDGELLLLWSAVACWLELWDPGRRAPARILGPFLSGDPGLWLQQDKPYLSTQVNILDHFHSPALGT